MNRTTFRADPKDLAVVKDAAKRRCINAAKIIRRADHLAALANRTWAEPLFSRTFEGPGRMRPRRRQPLLYGAGLSVASTNVPTLSRRSLYAGGAPMPGDTPELPAKDLRTLIPEYASLARETTLLNPEPGDPGVRESSLGGELLWPADEPWPYCAQEGHWTCGSDPCNHTEIVPGAVPMVPILQLFARDVPGLEFPESKDLLQLVWCALIHEQDPGPVMPQLYWRNEAEVVAGGCCPRSPR